MLSSFGKYRLVYTHLWRTYGQSWQVRLSFVIQVLSRVCKFVVLPIALSLIITKLSAKDFDGAQAAVLLFVGGSLTLGILTPLTKYIGMLGESKIYASSTRAYFSRLIHADLDYFHSNLSGYLTAATRHYVDGCVQMVRALRDRYISTILTILLPLIVIFWLDVWLGIVALGLSVVQAGYLVWASNAITPLRSRARELFKRNSGRMSDIIANILAVRSSAQEDAHTKDVGEDAVKEAQAFEERFRMQAKLTAIRELITVSFFMVLLWLTVQRMSGGHIDITAAVLVATYATTILTGIYSLSENLDEHDDLVDKIIPAFEIMDRQNAVNDPAKPKKLRTVKGEIKLEHVSFAYDQSAAVLEDFSLHIPAGQKVGVVGLSGAGKSTLTKLLLRFNDVDQGSVTLDGVDIRDIRQTDLRSQIAYVPQEPLLLHTSIKENVLLARPRASDWEVESALRAAHAMQFVEKLPDGLKSVVGERGVKLSGGQKQRIAIARAVLCKTPIMILDEATSALDSESEQIIKNSFAEILKGKTAIVVAHRLSTLSEMDRIVVIDKGVCVEDGTHEELLAKRGVYSRLWRRQLKHLED
jgi:ATP-binding cassette subfamily B protein